MAIDQHLDSAHDGPFGLHAAKRGATFRIALTGEFDLAAVAPVEEALATAFESDTKALEIDLSALTFLDSSGLRTILEARDRAASHEVALRLVPGIPAVQRVFQMTGLDDVLPFGAAS